MIDNLKTWPEVIYRPNIKFDNYSRRSEDLEVNADDIEYIRADIAKEREQAAYERGLSHFMHTEWPPEELK